MAKVKVQQISRVLSWVTILGGSVLGLTLLMLVLAGVFRPKVSSERPPPEVSSLPPTQKIGQVSSIRQTREETAIGTVRPVHEASVASKILARVVEVRVKAGQAVSQGDVLIRLDDAELQARHHQREAALAAAEAMLTRANSEHDRAVRLIERSAISRAEFDQAVATLKTAQAGLQQAQQAVEEAKVLLEFATILSPLTGVVIEKRVEPGDTAVPGQVLVNLYDPHRMQMVATVRESLALRLKIGDQVSARLDALDHECLATVSEIVPRAEAASRSFIVKVTGPCPPGVYSGMFGRISIPVDDEELLVVPASAVIRVGQLEQVEVIQEGQIRRRTAQLGRPVGDGYEVLAGLRAGEKVVLGHKQEDER